jgi:hypothetical protein
VRFCLGSDRNSECRCSPDGTFNSAYFHDYHLHGELQFAGGELSNKVLRAGTANSPSQPQPQSSPYSQCDRKHRVPNGLHVHSARVSKRMRSELSLSLDGPQFHPFNQSRIASIRLGAIQPLRDRPASWVVVRRWLQHFRSKGNPNTITE